MPPRVSVVIPTFNRRELLRVAVDSVLAQTMGDVEVLVADDGSTDGTAVMLAGRGDRRVRHLALPHAGEPATPRNAGIAEARAPLVAFLDSDDWWEPTKLERQLLDLPPGSWSFTGCRVVREGGTPLEQPARADDAGDILRPLLADAPVGAPISSVLAPTDLVRAIGGFAPETAFREDRAMLFRLAARAMAVPVPDMLVTIRDHPDRSTRRHTDHYTAWAAAYASFLPVAPAHVVALTRRQARRHLVRALPGGLARRRWWRVLARVGRA